MHSSSLNITSDVTFRNLWGFMNIQTEIGGVYVGQQEAEQGFDRFLFLCRAFKINELKTEVTNRLAMLEKRVERKCTLAFPLSSRSAPYRDVWFP